MTERPKRFIECLLPVTICNLKCSYCYIIQENRREMKYANLQYTPEHIAKAISPDRLGGISYISICGAGETLVQNEAIDIIFEILKTGHFVNVTTNGTISRQFDTILKFLKEYLERLHISFSFHYIELKKRNLLDVFFKNVNKMKEYGASVLVQFNLTDEYVPYLDEIKKLCIDKVGALPQVCATRKEFPETSLFTDLSKAEYLDKGKNFASPLFEFTMNNFNKKIKDFCYAGDWSGVLNLATGELRKCYGCFDSQNIFEDLNKPINFEAIGKHCKLPYCINSSHFLSLGTIPSRQTPSYYMLRNREKGEWYSNRMSNFLNHKLQEINAQYSILKKLKINFKGDFENIEKVIGRALPNNIRILIRNLMSKLSRGDRS